MLEITYKPLKGLVPYARNSKKHSREQLQKLKASLAEFGWTRPIAEADGGIIFGHGMQLAALEMAEASIPIPGNEDPWQAPTVDLSHLTTAQRRAYVIADNRLAEDAAWDEEMLGIELQALNDEGFNLELTGFELPELAEYVPGLLDSTGGEPPPAEVAEMLERMDITIDEPRHEVEPGDKFSLGERHYLLCVGVIEDWPDWAPLLTEGALFCPYPGPFVPFGAKAAQHQLVMVQPDIYIAGHILDRYADAHGEDAIQKL